MSDEQPVPQPAPDAPRGFPRLRVLAGFLIGGAFWVVPYLPWQGYDALLFLIIACFVVPPVAAVLAIFRKTRPFGLGMLLACGIGWLILGAMCGGLLG